MWLLGWNEITDERFASFSEIWADFHFWAETSSFIYRRSKSIQPSFGCLPFSGTHLKTIIAASERHFLGFNWLKLSSQLPEQRMHCSVSECVFLGVVNKYVSMLCDHILAAIFWPGLTFFWRPVFGQGSLFGALKLIPGAVEPASQTLHIYRGPGARWCWWYTVVNHF